LSASCVAADALGVSAVEEGGWRSWANEALGLFYGYDFHLNEPGRASHQIIPTRVAAS